MTDQQLKLAIAQMFPRGIQALPETRLISCGNKIVFYWADSTKEVTDREWLAVMAAFERPLHANWERQETYMRWLTNICYKTKHSGQSIEFALTNASWQQRAEAYLRTIGKYEEETR